MNKLTIYEAYLIQWEIINYERDGYLLPAWNGWVQISTCLTILNQKLLALIFNDVKRAKQLVDWGKEALDLCRERRRYHIMDRYMEFLDVGADDTGLLRELLTVRENYATLSFNEGPYHVEEFPYHYFEPERILIEKTNMNQEKIVSADIETMLIELNI